LASTSKIPPEFSEAAAQVCDGPFDLVEAFGFHGFPGSKTPDYRKAACSTISCTRRMPL
jgi:hypothetical protein